MKTYIANIYWRFSSENFEYGLIQANSEEEAKTKLKALNPNALSVYAYELEFDSDGYCPIYEH